MIGSYQAVERDATEQAAAGRRLRRGRHAPPTTGATTASTRCGCARARPCRAPTPSRPGPTPRPGPRARIRGRRASNRWRLAGGGPGGGGRGRRPPAWLGPALQRPRRRRRVRRRRAAAGRGAWSRPSATAARRWRRPSATASARYRFAALPARRTSMLVVDAASLPGGLELPSFDADGVASPGRIAVGGTGTGAQPRLRLPPGRPGPARRSAGSGLRHLRAGSAADPGAAGGLVCDAAAPLDTVFLLDLSGSLAAPFGGAGSRLEAAQLAIAGLGRRLAARGRRQPPGPPDLPQPRRSGGGRAPARPLERAPTLSRTGSSASPPASSPRATAARPRWLSPPRPSCSPPPGARPPAADRLADRQRPRRRRPAAAAARRRLPDRARRRLPARRRGRRRPRLHRQPVRLPGQGDRPRPDRPGLSRPGLADLALADTMVVDRRPPSPPLPGLRHRRRSAVQGSPSWRGRAARRRRLLGRQPHRRGADLRNASRAAVAGLYASFVCAAP